MHLNPVIELRDVAVALAGRPVLRGIDLSLGAGETVAVLGANGSGKSTLIRSMLGLVPHQRGEVLLFDTPLGEFREWRRVGFVPQRVSAAAGVPATVREVVASGRLSRRRLLRPSSRADRSAVADAIETIGLTDRAGDRVSTLSGGQQQRVLIARALAGSPDLFVLDEPTAGVDLHQQQSLADTLGVLRSRGVTIVLVAHELGPMTPLVDRTVVMRDGRIAYDGPLAGHQDDHGHDHGHHHPDLVRRTDHLPSVRSPLDRQDGGHHS